MTNRAGYSGTSSALVNSVQQRLLLQSWVRALAFGVGVGTFTWLAVSVVIPYVLPNMKSGIGEMSILVGVLAAAVTSWYFRSRDGEITRSRAALWLEERFPSLQFALVTLSEIEAQKSHTVSDDARQRLVSAVGTPNVSAPLNQSAVRQLRLPLFMAVLLLAVAGPLQARLSHAGGERFASSANTSRNLDDVGQVAALVGSQIEISGEDAETPTAVVRSTVDSVVPHPLTVTRSGDRWTTRLTMPESPADARFALGTANRQLLLEPRADSIPVVHLELPARDSVFREPKGIVALGATAHDDLGLQTVSFELIITSGEGERFTAKSSVLAAQRLNGERDHKWRTSLALDTMKLVPGDIIHMRAVARDRNPDASHELGASETRTFRIARANEYDSIAVDPAPPPEVQKSLMSQRMLLILTEKLVARLKTTPRETIVSESRKLAADQVRLRKAVGNLVFQRLEGEDSGEHSHSADDGHDHGVQMEQGKLVISASGGAAPMTDGAEGDSPIVGINKPLLEAFNAMWDAASALEIAEPKNAVPHMKLALAAIERARSAERVYLRGKPPVVIVDIAKIRLVGKDTGQMNTRAARDALSPKEAERETRLLSAALLLTRDAAAGRDSLALLRLESLTDAPRLAAAVSDVLEVVRRGGDATESLIRARRLISGGAKSDSLTSWRGM